MLHLLLRTALLVGVLLLAATTQAAEVVVVDDTTFDEGDWNFVKLPTQPDEYLYPPRSDRHHDLRTAERREQ